MMTVGELVAYLKLDDSHFNKGIDSAQKNFTSGNKKLSGDATLGLDDTKFNRDLESVKTKLRKTALVGGVAIAAALGSSLFLGFKRLSSIEDAKASLAGLGHSATEVKLIMDNALAAVKGTAFGLGDAATVAASTVAAGVAPGKELERILRLVADAATIGRTSIGEMGSVFNKVAASNKIQGDVIAQLNDMGIPIIQLLGKTLGATTDQVYAMSEAGTISFSMFATAMEKGLGGAALKSGNTTTGALKNVSAAASRFGARLLTGVWPVLKLVFDGTIKLLDYLEKTFGPVFDQLGKSITKFLKSDTVAKAFRDIGEVLKPLIPVVIALAKVGFGVLGAVAWLAAKNAGILTIGLGALGVALVALKIKSVITDIIGFVTHIGRAAVAEGVETAALGVNTAAIEANTVARTANGAIPLGSTAWETNIGRAGIGGAAGGGLATGAGLIAPGLALAAAGVATGFLAEWARSGDVSQNLKNMNAAGIPSQGRMAGSVPYSAAGAAANQAAMAPVNQAWKEFAVIAQKIKDARPGPGQAGALDRYKAQLTALERKYPVVAEQADKLKGALGKSAGAFDAAAQAATAAAEAIRTQFGSMVDFMTATMKAAVMGTPLPTAAQAAFASQSSQAAAFAAAQEKGYFAKQYAKTHPAASKPHFKLVKGKWVRAAAGVDFITQGPTPIIAGEAGTEHVKITPLGRKGAGVTELHVHNHFHGPVVGGQAGLRELSGIVQRDVMSGVRRGLVGQNA